MLRRFVRSLSYFIHAEDGPTAVEYAILLALLVIACVGMITALGSNASNTFESTASSLESASGNGSGNSGYTGVIGGSSTNGSWSTSFPGYSGLSMNIQGSLFSFQLNGNTVSGTLTQTGPNTYTMAADGYTTTMTVNGNTATLNDPNSGQTITFTKNN